MYDIHTRCKKSALKLPLLTAEFHVTVIIADVALSPRTFNRRECHLGIPRPCDTNFIVANIAC